MPRAGSRELSPSPFTSSSLGDCLICARKQISVENLQSNRWFCLSVCLSVLNCSSIADRFAVAKVESTICRKTNCALEQNNINSSARRSHPGSRTRLSFLRPPTSLTNYGKGSPPRLHRRGNVRQAGQKEQSPFPSFSTGFLACWIPAHH